MVQCIYVSMCLDRISLAMQAHFLHSSGGTTSQFTMSVPDGDLETVDDMPPQADNNSDVDVVPTPAASTFQLLRRVQQHGRPALSKQRTFRIKKRK